MQCGTGGRVGITQCIVLSSMHNCLYNDRLIGPWQDHHTLHVLAVKRGRHSQCSH